MTDERATTATLSGTESNADHGPTVLIRPHGGWRDLGIGELWQHRELLFYFIWRDIKVRYRQTAFGALWAIVQPLLLMSIFTVFLGRLAGVAPQGVPYPLFALAGLVPWVFFARSVGSSAGSLVGAANLLRKAYFPRLLLPLGAIGSSLIDYAISVGVLMVALLSTGWFPGLSILALAPLTILLICAALAVGIWLSAINVRYRDVGHAMPFLLQLWLFASPVAYSTDLLPDNLQGVFLLNPMVGVIESFRWAILGSPAEFPLLSIAAAIGVTGLLLVTGLAYFSRVGRTFADII